MQVEVGPARRPGRADTIHDRPLKKGDLQVEPDGGIALTIDASGRDGRSQYRYRISFTAAEAGRLVSVIASTSGNLPARFEIAPAGSEEPAAADV